MRLPTLPGHDDELWAALIELSELRPGEWTLVGGQMVFLHAMEHDVEPPRVSTDLDLLVNARVVTGGVREFVAAIEAVGFDLVGTSPEGIAHRYGRDGVSVDVLAPEGLGPRTDLTTTPPGRTLQVPGGMALTPDSGVWLVWSGYPMVHVFGVCLVWCLHSYAGMTTAPIVP